MSGLLKITPLGGLGEIGMNCMVLETEKEAIVIDCGILFSDLETFGIEFIIPNLGYLAQIKDKVKAYVITHGHEDHIGALPFALKLGVVAPIYASPFTSKLVLNDLAEYGTENLTEIVNFNLGDSFDLGEFKVRSIPVNHSIVEASALVIDTPLGRVVHTGDFKIDSGPYYGKTLDLKEFEKVGDEGVLLLLSDSTNVEIDHDSVSEEFVYKKLEEVVASMEGLLIVSMFSSNIARLGQVIDLAAKTGKKVALAGRSMEANSKAGVESGYLEALNSCLISIDDVPKQNRKDVIVVSTGSQGEFRSALTRIAVGEHKQVQLQEGDKVVLSSKFIPGNEIAISRVINQLFRQGADVLYEAIHEVHASGHATRPELMKMLKAIRPKYFIPVHGEYRHLVHHAAVARESGVADERVKVVSNGDVVELEEDRIEIVDHFEEQKILIERELPREMPRTILKERRKVAEKGVVFALLTRDPETRKIVAGPEILAKGVVGEETLGEFVSQGRAVVEKTYRDLERASSTPVLKDEVEEEIRLAVRRFCKDFVGIKPMVIPVVVDLN